MPDPGLSLERVKKVLELSLAAPAAAPAPAPAPALALATVPASGLARLRFPSEADDVPAEVRFLAEHLSCGWRGLPRAPLEVSLPDMHDGWAACWMSHLGSCLAPDCDPGSVTDTIEVRARDDAESSR